MSPLFRRRPRPERVDPSAEETQRLPPADETQRGPNVAETEPLPRRDERVVEERIVAEEPPRRPPTLWPYLLLLLLLVLGGIGALLYFTREEDKQTVPALVNLSVDEATRRLTNAGFRTLVERRTNPQPRGRVFGQRPGGGSQLNEGEAVTVLVSNGPAEVAVPNVVGLPADQAIDRLRGAKLRERRRGVFSEEPPGVVVAQEPGAGDRAAVGSPVRLNVSRGTGRVEVPDVVGRTSDDAGAIIRTAGLQARVVEIPSAEPEGTVVAQNPQPGAELGRGEFVRINVSTGEGGEAAAPPQAVPDTAGLTEEEARGELEAAGFETRVLREPTTEETEADFVIRQEPVAGREAPRGTQVTIYVGELTP